MTAPIPAAPAPLQAIRREPKRPAPPRAIEATSPTSSAATPSEVVPQAGSVASAVAPLVREAVSARPRYKVNPEPPYPVVARRRQQEGVVLLSVRVDAAGRPEAVTVQPAPASLRSTRPLSRPSRTGSSSPGGSRESPCPRRSRCRSASSSIANEQASELTAGFFQFSRSGVVSKRHGPRFRPLLSRPSEPGSPLRRALLRRRHDDRHLLPPDLSLADAALAQRALLRLRRRGAGGGLPALSALPPRDRSRDPRLGGEPGGGAPRAAADRAEAASTTTTSRPLRRASVSEAGSCAGSSRATSARARRRSRARTARISRGACSTRRI